MESVGLWPGEEPERGVQVPAEPREVQQTVAMTPRKIQIETSAPLILLLGFLLLLFAMDET